jgi:NADH:ubiquinone oxidoreductase subunit F (NADH-binding)
MAEEAVNAIEFFRAESCGKCVPCRLGSQRFAAAGANLLAGRVAPEEWEERLRPLLDEMGAVLNSTSICSLGRSVPVPLSTVARFFPEDIAVHFATAHKRAAS